MAPILDFFGLSGRAKSEAQQKRIDPPMGGRAKHPTRPRHVRVFDAARSDRLTTDWPTEPVTADEVIRRNYLPLVSRSRDQAANNDYARKFLRLCVQNIVGPKGIQLQAQSRDQNGNLDVRANEAIEAAWRAWGKRKNCDITGRKSFRLIASSAVLSAAKDGEFMIRLLFGQNAGPWGFALQVLDPLRCPAHLDQDDLPGGGFIRHGIEFNEFGRPVAYLFKTLKETRADYSFYGAHYVRVPADQIVHGFLEDIVGQKRGLPWMATGLWRLNMLHGFEKAALTNARVSASKSGFFEWEEGMGPEADESEEIFLEAEPGTFQELPAGVRFKEWNPQYPNGEFAVFHKAMLRGAAAGFGVAYNNLANDLEGVNFSSIRQGTLDEREHWKELQEWLIESLIEPIFEAWLPRALLRGIKMPSGGTLRPENLEKYSVVSWQARRWQWIDPNSETKAAILSKDNLLSSPSQIIRENGQDPDAVWREIGRDINSMIKAGIPEKFIHTALKLSAGVESDDNENSGQDEEPGGAENAQRRTE